MCVIAVKPKNTRITFSTVADMYQANPHGAGMAILVGEKTIVSKGYMDLSSFWKDIEQVQDSTVILHFRWATHGEVNEDMTHPFIIDSEILNAVKIYDETDSPILIHNGVLHGYGNKIISDTCDMAVNTLSKLGNIQDMLKLLNLTSSKFTLINKGKIHYVGKFYKYRGLKVSNTDFIPYRYGDMKNGNKLFNGKISDYSIEWQNDCAILTEPAYSGKGSK